MQPLMQFFCAFWLGLRAPCVWISPHHVFGASCHRRRRSSVGLTLHVSSRRRSDSQGDARCPASRYGPLCGNRRLPSLPKAPVWPRLPLQRPVHRWFTVPLLLWWCCCHKHIPSTMTWARHPVGHRPRHGACISNRAWKDTLLVTFLRLLAVEAAPQRHLSGYPHSTVREH